MILSIIRFIKTVYNVPVPEADQILARLYICLLYTSYEIAIEENDGILSIRYHGDGFLYNMVRILTGTLLEVGLGDRSLPEVRLALEGKDRSLAGFTAPPQGLFLVDVFYPAAEEERTL